MEKENIRFYIQMRFMLGSDARSIHNDFVAVLTDNAPGYSTVARWIQHFKQGRENLKDEQRIGRPITEKTAVNIERVRLVIQDNPYSTFDEIEAETSLSRGTIQTIIHDCLEMKKITSRWVPHSLSDKNRQDRVRVCQENLAKFKDGEWRLCDIITGDESWFYWCQVGRKQANKSWIGEGDSPRTLVRPDRFGSKTMVSIFFRTSGVEHITYWNKGNTITSQSYIEDCLKPLLSSVKRERKASGLRGIKFHHDNARPHVAKCVQTYLEEQNLQIMEQPPYSPDLAPSDFWLFDYIKQQLEDHTSVESLMRQITKILHSTPKAEFRKTFDKWLERMQLCIDNQGNYFEHIIKKI